MTGTVIDEQNKGKERGLWRRKGCSWKARQRSRKGAGEKGGRTTDEREERIGWN